MLTVTAVRLFFGRAAMRYAIFVLWIITPSLPFEMRFMCSAYYTHTHPFNGPFSGTTQVSWYQKGKTNLDFTEIRDSEWQ